MNAIVVTAPGTEVMIGTDREIRARIDKVQISSGMVPKYFLSWWDGRTLQTSEFDASEFKPVAASNLRIGFQ